MVEYARRMAKNDRPEPPSRVVGQQVRAIREGRRWSQSVLADELEKVGRRIGQSEIARLERPDPDSGGRPTRAVSVEDLYALALALDVAPIALLIPGGDASALAEVAGSPEKAESIRAWVIGSRPLERDGVDVDRWNAHAAAVAVAKGSPGLGSMLRTLAERVDTAGSKAERRRALTYALSTISGALLAAELPPRRSRPQMAEMYPAGLPVRPVTTNGGDDHGAR